MESALTHQIAEYNRLRRSEGEPEMTQKRLAELLGVTQGAVSLWATGRRSMTAQTAIEVAGLLSCRVEDLFTPAVSQAVISEANHAA